MNIQNVSSSRLHNRLYNWSYRRNTSTRVACMDDALGVVIGCHAVNMIQQPTPHLSVS